MQSLKKWIYQDKPEIIETDMGYSKLISMIGKYQSDVDRVSKQSLSNNPSLFYKSASPLDDA